MSASIDPTTIIVDNFNYIGAAIFWLYIAAALYFTFQIGQTIVQIKPPQDGTEDRKEDDVYIFSSLAAVSFAALTSNMLDVLKHSYQAWSGIRSLGADWSLTQVWRWSTTSTLFQDFAEGLIGSEEGYLWVQSALFVTMAACVFMGLAGKSLSGVSCVLLINSDHWRAGRQYQVPRLGLFFCLSQILPISITLNLFYVALSRLPDRPREAKLSAGILPSIGAYSLCLLFAPWTAGGFWLLATILVARILLFSPLLLAEPDNGGRSRSMVMSRYFSGGEEAQSAVGVAAYVFLAHQGYRVFAHRSNTTHYFGLFGHPAVTAMGFDLMLTVLSYLVWTLRVRTRPANRAAISKTK